MSNKQEKDMSNIHFTLVLLFVAACSIVVIWFMVEQVDRVNESVDRINDQFLPLVSELRTSQDYQTVAMSSSVDRVLDVVKSQELECDCSNTEIYVTHDRSCESQFETIAYDMARQIDYELDEYDCTEYSKALANRYNELGWKARTKFVRVQCDMEPWSYSDSCGDGAHQIVVVKDVYIEATSGRVIHPDYYEAWGIR